MFVEDLTALMNKREPLNPSLRPYVRKGPVGQMIQHPLVQEIIYRPEMNALFNKRLAVKQEALSKAIDDKRWSSVIWIHERPWRIEVLMKYQDRMTDAEYWESVGTVWTDSENIWQHSDDWRNLWGSVRAGKENSMEEEEQKLLADMPDSIQVFRGIGGMGMIKQRRQGMSWTTDREKAEWFAKRWSQNPNKILEGTVKKKDVHAYFIGRGESEIVSSSVKLSKQG